MILELCLIAILAPLSILLFIRAVMPTPPEWKDVKHRDFAVSPDGTPIYTKRLDKK